MPSMPSLAALKYRNVIHRWSSITPILYAVQHQPMSATCVASLNLLIVSWEKPPCNRRKTLLEEEEEYHSLKYIQENSQQHYSSLLSRKPISSICFSCLSRGKGFVRMSATMSVVGIYTNQIKSC